RVQRIRSRPDGNIPGREHREGFRPCEEPPARGGVSTVQPAPARATVLGFDQRTLRSLPGSRVFWTFEAGEGYGQRERDHQLHDSSRWEAPIPDPIPRTGNTVPGSICQSRQPAAEQVT